ncbi:MAG: translation initiation factor IF-2 [Litorilinea sp.]|nr:MAG: translation initiation factor IF-2 [Litorilinea sp.]
MAAKSKSKVRDLDLEEREEEREIEPRREPKGKGQKSVNGHKGARRDGKAATAEAPKEVVVGEAITVRDLAKLMDRSPIDLIKVLMQYGIMAPITHSIDHDTAVILGEELGIAVKWPEPEKSETEEAESQPEQQPQTPQNFVQRIISQEKESDLVERPPVVAVLGHVDHGKTTLLDRIRNTNVAAGEAGGITQRTGAYQVTVNGRKITFLDTPGHEAFTAMRARGAQVTDIVVLVVAADDGVMPQTREAISHARAAGVTIIVALNKIDKANANPQRVMEELAQEGLQPEEWGGDTIVVPVSALNNIGIDELLENILVVAEVEEYKANPKGRCVGTVIEAELDKHRGVTATLLVQNGTLKRGDTIVVDTTWGRIKAMFDFEGKPIKEAGPSTPVVILGLQELPKAGDIFERVKNDREAKRIVQERLLEREQAAQAPKRQMSLDELFARFEGGETKTLNLIVRADMQGTLEPIVKSLEDLSNDEITVKILQAAIGDISESDVMLAEASDAVIIGFSVGVDRAAQVRAEQSGVEIRHYDVIYKMIEDVEAAITGMLEPVYQDVVIGHAQVLQLFKLRRGTIAGCSVTDGVIKRNAMARVLRNGQEVISGTRIETLRRFTEDVNEVRTGFECGIKLAEGDDDLQEGDIIEVYERQRVR